MWESCLISLENGFIFCAPLTKMERNIFLLNSHLWSTKHPPISHLNPQEKFPSLVRLIFQKLSKLKFTYSEKAKKIGKIFKVDIASPSPSFILPWHRYKSVVCLLLWSVYYLCIFKRGPRTSINLYTDASLSLPQACF